MEKIIKPIKKIGILKISNDIISVRNSLDDTTIIPPTNDRMTRKEYSLKNFLNSSALLFDIIKRPKSVPKTNSIFILLVISLFSKELFKK